MIASDFSETTAHLVGRLRDLTVLTSQIGAAVELAEPDLDVTACGVLEDWRAGAMHAQIAALDKISANYKEILAFLGYEVVPLGGDQAPGTASSEAAREYQALAFRIKRLGDVSIRVQRAFDRLSGIGADQFMASQLSVVRHQRDAVTALLDQMETLLEELSFLRRLAGTAD